MPVRHEQLMDIVIGGLDRSEVQTLLHEHLQRMRQVSPPESVHALDLAGLRQEDVSFWSIWQGARLAGCGALKQLDTTHAEIKSMRTHDAFLRQGVARRMLLHILQEARARGYRRLSLETGSMAYFLPAVALYQQFGFVGCGPFGGYHADPNSVFMTLELNHREQQPVV